MSAATQNARISTTAGDAFGDGAYKVATLSVKTTDASKPPRPLHIVYPTVAEEAAEFGVLLLLHGYMLNNTFYSQLMQHVASFGFVVVAPQLYDITLFNSTEAIKRAAGITAWLAGGGLQKVLPPNITADVTHRLALSGHSRGGREAFVLALGIAASSSLPLSALIGIDPVAGSRFGQTSPAVLSNDANSSFTALNHLPVMVIGSGLDGFISCTPKGVSHAEFYRECERPACYFVVKDYGHLDMLDDDTGGMKGWMSHYMCKNGSSREPMRRFVGGASVAFLKAYLDKDDSYFINIKNGDVKLPVELNKVDFRL